MPPSFYLVTQKRHFVCGFQAHKYHQIFRVLFHQLEDWLSGGDRIISSTKVRDKLTKCIFRKCLRHYPAVSLVLIGISIILVARAHYWSNQKIMREIARHGGSVLIYPDGWIEHRLDDILGEQYEWIYGSDCKINHVYLQNLSFDEILLLRFSELKKMWGLYLDYSNITDRGCKYIGSLPYLDELSLTKTLVTDAGLKHLQELDLSYLVLDETAITDHGVSHLTGMSSLTWLQLCDTKITDDGLGHLSGLQNLENLWLENTQVSDEGLQHIRKFKSLKYVDLQGTHVTKSGVQKLMNEMTSLSVNW